MKSPLIRGDLEGFYRSHAPAWERSRRRSSVASGKKCLNHDLYGIKGLAGLLSIKSVNHVNPGSDRGLLASVSYQTGRWSVRGCVPTLERGNDETILVAEDDGGVRKLIVSVLTSFGYNVIEAVDGENAVAQFASHQDRIGLVLLDMIMPGKNGWEASAEIARMQPSVKILYSSGYTADFLNKRGAPEEGIEVISKPVQPEELLRKVREKLDT